MATGGETRGTNPFLPKEQPLLFLKEITDNFSNERKIGEGKFGKTYEGILKKNINQGTMEDLKVVVKRFKQNSSIQRNNFLKLVQTIIECKHDNIVSLIDSCQTYQDDGRENVAEVTETILCYEYCSEGNLHKIVEKSSNTPWATRYNIVKGICLGLRRLHNMSVCHSNLKPQNVLLDAKMTPKIMDFALESLFDPEKRITRDLSSFGDAAPSDIFSLGLMILEITTRNKINPRQDQEDKVEEKYINAVKKNWNQDKIFSEYPDLHVDEYHEVELCIKVGLECVKAKERNRPSIDIIVKMLNDKGN